MQKHEPSLRIVAINDAYELEHMPKLKTFLEAQRAAHPNVLVTLAGDFLAPSMLSSIDRGKSMIAVLNRIGVDLVCFGNHEIDVPHASCLHRITEFKGM